MYEAWDCVAKGHVIRDCVPQAYMGSVCGTCLAPHFTSRGLLTQKNETLAKQSHQTMETGDTPRSSTRTPSAASLGTCSKRQLLPSPGVHATSHIHLLLFPLSHCFPVDQEDNEWWAQAASSASLGDNTGLCSLPFLTSASRGSGHFGQVGKGQKPARFSGWREPRLAPLQKELAAFIINIRC